MATEIHANQTGTTSIEVEDEEVEVVGGTAAYVQQPQSEENISSSLINDNERADNKQEGLPMTIELPRDILTAYILCRLSAKGRWKALSKISRACVLFGLIGSYVMQFAVFFSFVGNLDFDSFSTGDTSGGDFWFNLIAIAALFMYLWKDVIAFYNSVWFWIGRVEKDRDIQTFSKIKNLKNIKNVNIKEIGHDMKEKMKNVTHLNREKLSTMYEGVEFWQFRLGLIAVFVLYGGYALYSLLAIGNYNGDLVDKISVAVQIFFILEIDDWACSLFILGPGLLDDADFDVEVIMPGETKDDENKRIQRRLLSTTVILVASILIVYTFSNYSAVV